MSFHAPAFLAALLLLPVGAFLYVRAERRRARRASEVVHPRLLAAVLPRRPGARRHIPIAFHALALAALLIALARPHATMAVETQRATVVVLTDRSGSMQSTDVSPTRLVAARRAADTFLDAVKDGVKVGAVAFNHEPTVLQSPTTDYATVKEALAGVKAAGSTATGDALAAALKLIADQQRAGTKKTPAAIVLLSDGKSVRGQAVVPVARKAKQAGVPVYTVALGTPAGTITTKDGKTTPVPPDTATLRRVAQITGGKAYAIQDAAELKRVYERLGSQVATEKRDQEVTGLFAGGALILVAGGVLASLRTFGRLV
jgi:Ca-activated chloride channel family protein